MGADLIVHILVGPKKFPKADIKKAKEFGKLVVREAKFILRKLEKDPEYCMSAEEWSDSPLRPMLIWEDYHSLQDARTIIEDLATAKPSKVIDDFVVWWLTLQGRDTAGRDNPSDHRTKIVVCGDMSWGDSPDGYGWTMVRKAGWFNLLHYLKIF